jgi:hypothetical protein
MSVAELHAGTFLSKTYKTNHYTNVKTTTFVKSFLIECTDYLLFGQLALCGTVVPDCLRSARALFILESQHPSLRI